MYLEGTFAPTQEELNIQQGLAVEGTLPPELSGVYLRIGPNPLRNPVGSYHWFDGDGMVHACRLKDGKVSYSNRYVETYRLQLERAAGRAVCLKLGDMNGLRGLGATLLQDLLRWVGYLDSSMGVGTANTALVMHARKLLALHEGDLPYQIRMLCSGIIETVGRLKMGKTWGAHFTAHPKTDPSTGQLHFFGVDYSMNEEHFLRYGCMSPEGKLIKSIPVPIRQPIMMHDFAVTSRHAVFFDVPLVFEPKAMVQQGGLPFVFKEDCTGRIGLLPFDAVDGAATVWFELPSFFMFHTINAYEVDDGTVKVYACQYDQLDLGVYEEWQATPLAYVTEYTLDPRTGTATSRRLSNTPCEFPVTNPGLVGRKTRYAWAGANSEVGGEREVRPVAIAKYDLLAEKGTDACVGLVRLPKGWQTGEAVFVPRYEDPSLCQGEDDGFLVLFASDPEQLQTYFLVHDAKTMASEPLARVRMPHMVPHGFHGLFLRDHELQEQML